MGDERWEDGEQLIAALAATVGLLDDLPVSVSRLSASDLGAVLSVVDRLAAVAAAGRFTLASEADARGEVAASPSGSLRQWLTDRCPALDARTVGVLARAVTELKDPTWQPARLAVTRGDLSVPAGLVVASELAQLRPLVEPEAEAAVLDGLVAIGQSHGSAGVRSLRPALLARYGLGSAIQDEQDRRAGLTQLSCGHDIGGGITEYRMRLTPESRAVVEAALDALSRPRPQLGVADRGDGSGRSVDPWRLDSRTIEQRRGDALVDVCRRFVSLSVASGSPGGSFGDVTPSGVKATLLVTLSMADLRYLKRPGRLLGHLDCGTLLGPETVRRLGCDGAVIAAVLGADGEVLHFGRTRRLFTSAQTRALWLRDRHCTYPGCSTPATWCDAHHIRHWADGGPTDLSNAALLCGRHHTVVHRDRLTAAFTTGGVVWDRDVGSYDRAPPGASEPGL
jgi:hypothetical protein